MNLTNLTVDQFMSIYGYMVLFIFAVAIVCGIIAIISSEIGYVQSKRNLRKARQDYEEAKRQFFLTHGY